MNSRLNYKFISTKHRLELQSKTHRLILKFLGEHVSGTYNGKKFKTSIRADINQFEKRVVAFQILSVIRDNPETWKQKVDHTNYAQCLMSCFEQGEHIMSSPPFITVSIRTIYGVEKYYPFDESAKLFARLSGTLTLTPDAIIIIKNLGYRILINQETKEEL